jgi:hypothetical protein
MTVSCGNFVISMLYRDRLSHAWSCSLLHSASSVARFLVFSNVNNDNSSGGRTSQVFLHFTSLAKRDGSLRPWSLSGSFPSSLLDWGPGN